MKPRENIGERIIKLREEIDREITFIKNNDPSKQSEKMQGALYAFNKVRKAIKRELFYP